MAMKDVMLKITGTSTSNLPGEEGKKDVVEFVTEGKLGKLGKSTLIVYPEAIDTVMEGVTTYITISPNMVKVKRSYNETEESFMEFQTGKRFESQYLTPYGAFSMELLTNKISKFDDEKQNLKIDYNVSLRGLSQSRNTLDIQVLGKEEGESEQ